jgi:phosphoribosylformimino-5-aminoimidazole carboxamide ribotide isomerase
MQIWPAIDLRGGRCVRLRQGDFQRETVFSGDPAAIARRWVDEGAERLHLVDLDAAREGAGADGRVPNWDSIAAIVRASGVTCQVGGGVRDERTIDQLLGLGVSRLVIGTRAVKDADWFRDVCRRYPDRIVLGIDARNGRVATDGWTATSDRSAIEVARGFLGEPLAGIVYTDIAADGMLRGPNVAAMAAMRRAVPLPVVASGGVTTVEDVDRLAAAGLAGCIIGRALYEGRISLAEARAAAGAARPHPAVPG